MNSTGAYFFYQNDHLDTPQRLTAINGTTVWSAIYEAFGAAVVDPASTVTNNLRFAGQYYDSETGLHYNWNRYYDPGTGRYITSDPIALAGGDNLYLYALANPLTNKDPKGLDTTGCTISGIGPILDLSDCALKCCAVHDLCYYANNCSSGSWPWPVGDKKKNKCDSSDEICTSAGSSGSQNLQRSLLVATT